MNQLYSLDFRKKVLEMYLSGVSAKDIVHQTGVSRSRVYAWINEAKLSHHRQPTGNSSSVHLTDRKSVASMTPAEKAVLLDQFRKSKNKTSFALEHQIPRSTLYRWNNEDAFIRSYKGTTINIKMYFEALRSNEKLQKTIEVLQNAHCTVFSPLQERLSEMERLSAQYSNRVLCSAFCVDRATFYNHMNHNKRENAWFNIRRDDLKIAIDEIYHEHAQIPGSQKMRALLMQKGFHVSIRIVTELMREMGITSIRNNAKQIYLSRTEGTENEINIKNLCPGDRPNQIWVSDFTFFRIRENTFYVCIIMDLCSRRILAYKTGKKATTQMLIQCFHIAFTLRSPIQNLIFHSDQGSQYTSYSFKNLLKECGVIQSFSRRGKPTDNAVMESFNRNFKLEELYRHEYLSVKKFKAAIDTYVQYYNEARPHETLNYLTPLAFEQKFLKQDCPDTLSKS